MKLAGTGQRFGSIDGSSGEIAGGQEMPIKFRCESCGRQFVVKEQFAGRRTKCSQCGKILTVPDVAVPQGEMPDRRETFVNLARVAAKPRPPRKRFPIGWILLVLVIAAGAFFAWRHFSAPYVRGTKLFKNGSYDDAALHFQKAIEAGSHECDSHVYLARIHALRENYEEGISECNKALAVASKDRNAHVFLIIIYQLNNQFQEAEMTWDKAKDLPGLNRGFVLAAIQPPPVQQKLHPMKLAHYEDILKESSAIGRPPESLKVDFTTNP
jgi:hypothetical protein